MSIAPSKSYYRTLTIAGSDSGGGAGIQADLKTFSALGCFGMTAVTALTAQNTEGVRGIFPVDPAFVGEQIDAVVEDIGVDAVKIGMLHDAAVIGVVADRLRAHGLIRVVLDPVMVAQSGDALIEDEAVAALKERLIPLVSVITPNLPEAAILLGRAIAGREGTEAAARTLLELGAPAVLVKGGHGHDDESADCLAARHANGEARVRWFTAPRVATANVHGTGCTLSSAIAAYLARGETLGDAVAAAKRYVTRAIEAGAHYTTGRGSGPLHHFHHTWA